jgi:hypothetical protein
MKRLKGMKKQNKWMLMMAVAMMCLVTGLTQLSQAAAAEEEEDLITLDYLDPFDLTVTSLILDAPLRLSGLGTTDVDGDDLSDIAVPTKIWIPVRPTFRSPCVPSWW